MTRTPRHIPTYTRQTVAGEPDGRLVSPSFARNAGPIAEVLIPLLAGRTGTVLEVGAGPGQHSAHFAGLLAGHAPGLRWLPTDPEPGHLASIEAWRAFSGTEALLPPARLDATDDWETAPAIDGHRPLAAVYVQNVLHIAPWAVTEGIVAGAAATLAPGAPVIVYGPFREGGVHTGEGNARFDAALRADNPEWGVRCVDEIGALAEAHGLTAPTLTPMPSNNRVLVMTRRG